MRQFAYGVRYRVVLINSLLLAITFYYSVITTLVHNDTNIHYFITKFDSMFKEPSCKIQRGIITHEVILNSQASQLRPSTS